MYGLHRNSSQWQRPHEFLPERFDSSDPLSLTPAGMKRSPGSFAPFNGGKRICLGKNFAETNLKILLTYMTQRYECEHVERRFNETEFPYSHLLKSSNQTIMVKLKARKC